MKTEILRADHPVALRHAVDVLRNGGLVAFPTDTVYGLAALPFQKGMVERLYSIKGRSNTKAIAILIGKKEDMELIAGPVGDMAMRLAERFWPGPLTLVVPGHPDLPKVISPNATVGVRMPDHPIALALLREVGPLAVTSANLSGNDNANTAQEVIAQLKGRIHLILDGGRTPGGIPSTVIDSTGAEPVMLRDGPISLDEIRSVHV
jgi:L-threonylcarbamoyladenylate synthase